MNSFHILGLFSGCELHYRMLISALSIFDVENSTLLFSKVSFSDILVNNLMYKR